MELNKCQKCQSANMVMVEYSHDHPAHYDGASEVACLDCKARLGRWSGKELIGGEYELRFGGR